ncbi:Release factor glutamine methyltransferase [Roseivivax jejudonensis]|uniref:Release factor glutamine methyltransferase n=1 Tax=Roseivivax jejudonensis TaxID=1529041 RepID=A0A1X6YT15_9RHOB|nr:peptide chain release factor N(5)-glutamine methyltransferase [Roseivivax jejudonensis]SLN29890.1 Release factor glutamine methyltransferase [Roseivivax jejudonensis]
MIGRDALAAAARRLEAAGIPDPARDARRLLAHALAVPPARLTLALADPVPEDAAARFEALVDRRAARVPLSHLTGLRAFWGREFRVTADVLDPRPETETLIAAALQAPFSRLLDLGTGSGCILLSLLAERPTATGIGTDVSEAALAIAAENAARLGLRDRADLRLGSWTAQLSPGARFDLVVSNPPYIAADEMAGLAPEVRNHEPAIALTDQRDGLTAYRAIARAAPAHLMPGGRLLVEIGATQGEAVREIFASTGVEGIEILRDLDGRDRVIAGIWPQDAAR